MLAMSQSTVLLLPCANQNDLEANKNDLEGNLLDFPVQNTCENYIFLKVAEVLVVPPKVLTVCVRSLLTSKVSSKTNKRVQMLVLEKCN